MTLRLVRSVLNRKACLQLKDPAARADCKRGRLASWSSKLEAQSRKPKLKMPLSGSSLQTGHGQVSACKLAID